VNIPPIPIPNNPEPPGQVLAAGDCDNGDTYGLTATLGAGTTVLGVVLTVDGIASGIQTLAVTANSASGNTPAGRLYHLQVANDAGWLRQDELQFGAGVNLAEAWTFTGAGGACTWIVYGR
jgi:hypothetical protein